MNDDAKKGGKLVTKMSHNAIQVKTFLINFSVINLFVLLVLALCFLFLIPAQVTHFISVQQHSFASYSFVMLGLIGQIGLLGLIGLIGISIVTAGLCCIFRNSYYYFIVVLVASFMMTLLILLIGIDFVVYRLIGDHLTVTFWNVLFSGAFFQVIVLSNAEWLSLFFCFCTLLVFELILASCLWQRKPIALASRLLFVIVALILAAFCYAYLFYFINRAVNRDVPQLAKVIPYFNQLVSRLPLSSSPKRFHYPEHELVFARHIPKVNVLMIVIDTWRADMLNATVTPNIAQFASQSIRFTNHYSGGNFTRPGIFSLLYSLTPNYWYQIRQHQVGPILIQQLLDDNYHVKVLLSASPRFPDFVDTVFRAVPQAWQDTPGMDAAQRDLNITNEFEQFLATRDPAQPFFGFLFYDAVHNWCGSSQPYQKPFLPSITTCNRLALSGQTNPLPYLNRYRNAVHYDDQLIGNILNELKQNALLKNTIIMITADHGEEFNDSHRGMWGHGSAFDSYQLHVPFILYWPGVKPHRVTYRTSHYDVVPTLMHDLLKCSNAAATYSVGHDLFSKNRPPYIIIGSYGRYATLYDHSIKVNYPGGYSFVYNLDGQPFRP